MAERIIAPPPPKEALDYLRNKGYKVGWDYRDVWRKEHTRAFTVAKVLNQDLLIDIRKHLDDSLANGKTLEQFKDALNPVLAKYGWTGHQLVGDKVVELGTPRRLKIIYDTNLRTARAAGQWERIQRTKAVLPYLIYTLGPSREHRAEHIAWAGTKLSADDPWWDTHYPINGWGCKCRVRQMTERQVAAEGGLSTAPPIERVPWVNQRTGQTEMVPVGIDPGWDYNVGKDRDKQLGKTASDKTKEYTAVVGAPLPKPVIAQPSPVTTTPDGPKRVVPSAYTTSKSISADDMEAVFAELPQTEQLAQLKQFAGTKGIKTLLLNKSQMQRGSKSARAIGKDVSDYVHGQSDTDRYPLYSISASTRSMPLGFTAADIDHVVIQINSKTKIKPAKDIAKELTGMVQSAAKASDSGVEYWSMGASVSDNAHIISTWIHEVGHQVHYYAGAPHVPSGVKHMTKYSRTNAYEYHAEHFVAWILDRASYAEWDPVGAAHYDKMMAKALSSKVKSRLRG